MVTGSLSRPCGLVFEGDRRLDECSCGALLVRVPAFGQTPASHPLDRIQARPSVRDACSFKDGLDLSPYLSP